MCVLLCRVKPVCNTLRLISFNLDGVYEKDTKAMALLKVNVFIHMFMQICLKRAHPPFDIYSVAQQTDLLENNRPRL